MTNQDPRIEAGLDRIRSRSESNRLEAYYYSFDPTGNAEIDLILAAVAWAGKAYHYTSEWNEDSEDEASCVDLIQHVAEKAAAAFANKARGD